MADNIPVQATRLIGRAAEMAEIERRLLDPTVRLLTLTGPAGTGKTRLALAAAAGLGPSFPDGVVMVPLAPLAEPARVVPTIGRALGLRETSDAALVDATAAHLASRSVLLVLDGCEHLLAAG